MHINWFRLSLARIGLESDLDISIFFRTLVAAQEAEKQLGARVVKWHHGLGVAQMRPRRES